MPLPSLMEMQKLMRRVEGLVGSTSQAARVATDRDARLLMPLYTWPQILAPGSFCVCLRDVKGGSLNQW